MSQRSRSLNSALVAALPLVAILAASAAVIFRVTVRSSQELGWSAYGYSEWLINYSAGFTRRGLAGDIFHHLTAGAAAMPAVNWVVFCSFLVVSACLILLFVLSPRGGFGLAVLLPVVPGGLLSMAVNGTFFYRKEFQATAMFAILCVLYRLSVLMPRRAWRNIGLSVVLLIAWLALPIATLNHESYVFLDGIAVAILLYAVASDLGFSRPARLASSYVGVGVLGFLAMAYFHGSARIAAGVWNSLSTFDQAQIAATGIINKTSGGAIGAIGWTVADVLKLDVVVLTSGLVWYWLFALCVAGLFSVAIFCTDDPAILEQSALRPSDRAGLFVVLALSSLPLYLLGWDWGRWIATTAMLAVLSGLTLTAQTARAVIPAAIRRPFESLDASLATTSHWQRRIGLSILLVVGLSFRIPECCIDGSGTANGEFYRALLFRGVGP